MDELMDGTPAYEAPCWECGRLTEVSAAALEMCKHVNHILKSRGEKLMTRKELARCRECYLRENDRMWQKQRKESEEVVGYWRNFKNNYRKKAEQADRDAYWGEFEAALRKSGYWESYASFALAWKLEEDTRMTSRKPMATRKSDAGFTESAQ